jgi:hypothetical protein
MAEISHICRCSAVGSGCVMTMSDVERSISSQSEIAALTARQPKRFAIFHDRDIT